MGLEHVLSNMNNPDKYWGKCTKQTPFDKQVFRLAKEVADCVPIYDGESDYLISK